jgi:hypothetical protein
MVAVTVDRGGNKKILLEYYLAVFPSTVYVSAANWGDVHSKPSDCALLQVK